MAAMEEVNDEENTVARNEARLLLKQLLTMKVAKGVGMEGVTQEESLQVEAMEEVKEQQIHGPELRDRQVILESHHLQLDQVAGAEYQGPVLHELLRGDASTRPRPKFHAQDLEGLEGGLGPASHGSSQALNQNLLRRSGQRVLRLQQPTYRTAPARLLENDSHILDSCHLEPPLDSQQQTRVLDALATLRVEWSTGRTRVARLTQADQLLLTPGLREA
mmetsp:Transcript_39175/g.95188  ORF Transcript_39175/g.95188 Transcript_39175/m.95188 type:complete len:219 (-) Transcript_39175:2003-2659(-)